MSKIKLRIVQKRTLLIIGEKVSSHAADRIHNRAAFKFI